MKFIVTKDADVARQLRDNGFGLVSSSNGIFTFINNDKVNFDLSEVRDKIVYTNKFFM